MEIEIGRGKKARRAYGFDDIAIVPSRRTRDPDDVDISWKLGDSRFELPLLASAMDGVVSPATAGIIGRLGGLGVLNLEGIWTRYEDPESLLERIAGLPKDEATREMRGLGAREAIMTTPDGCFATVLEDGEPTLYRVRIEPRETVATVGAGDAFLAGYVAARYAGAAPAECLRQGVACGAESTQRLGAGLVDPSTIGRLVSETQVERVTVPAEVS